MQKAKKQEFLKAYDDYADAIYRYCFFRIFRQGRAEELTQETFMRAWEYLRDGKKIDNMKAFLYRIANNLIIDNARKKKEASLDELLEQSDAFEPTDDGEKSLERRVLLKDVHNAMEKLEDEDRELLTLRFVQDLDPREIAKIVHLDANNVSVKIHRALQTLKTHFQN